MTGNIPVGLLPGDYVSPPELGGSGEEPRTAVPWKDPETDSLSESNPAALS